ncbi:PepSY domain-containing protein [Geopsychrobacter electrodiphilus]|uniref:PepSY domain-containing protein n=1 Tax=Geopsychrobacter electrodiphilus TaxID=225196 RepID=UPI00035F74E9|nr:PepSY domain-containing protein [Geopsychrobacter electrodiphilus]
MKKIAILGLLTLILATATMTVKAWADENNAKNDKALAEARITLNQAVSGALAVVPGKAISAELDDEDATAVYRVEIVSHEKTYRVTLDTQNGKVLAKQLDTADNDHDGDKNDKKDKD